MVSVGTCPCWPKKLFIKTNFLSSPTLHKCKWFDLTRQIKTEMINFLNEAPIKLVPGKNWRKSAK